MPAKVAIPLYFGRKDSVEPRVAPLGVLATAKNLRVRKDGRLACRNGYTPATMSVLRTGGNATLKAYDLFQHQGRLMALGSDAATQDAFSVEAFEYVNANSHAWRGQSLDATGDGIALHPFTALREVAQTAQVDGGAVNVRSACGGGYVATLITTLGTPNDALFHVVRQSDDQTIFKVTFSASAIAYTSGQPIGVCFSVDSFYVMAVADVYRFTPGTDTSLVGFTSSPINSSATVFDIRPVQNQTTARFIVAFDQGATTDLSIMAFDSAGAQVGTTCTVAGTNTVHISVQADQTGNKIGLLTVEAAAAVRLRTFNFSGSLLVGPTALGSTGVWAELCLYTQAGAAGLTYAVAIADSSAVTNTVVENRTVAAHALGATATLGRLVITTQIIPWSTRSINQGFAFGAVVYDDELNPTNALVYTAPAFSQVAHVAFKDYLTTRVNSGVNLACGMSVDTANGVACWSALRDSGGGDPVPTHTLFDYQSAKRRQAVSYGGLTYLAAAAPSVFDGRSFVEVGFGEAPAIDSLAASNSTGTLTNSATYRYLVVWSYTLADGSFFQSPPSTFETVTMGAADDTVTVTLSVPHSSVMLTAGRDLGDVTAEVYRTVWDATAGAPASDIFRLVGTVSLTTGAAAYGDTVQFVDTVPDSTLASNGAVYTQSARGPLSGTLEHNAPRACQYIAATEGRLITGGLARSFEFQVSKEAFLGEAFSFSEFSSFFGQVSGPVKGVAARGSRRYVFTRDDIYALGSSAPDDVGGGTLDLPVRIPSPGGLLDWRSLLETPDGLWFQLADGQLYQLQDTPGGGASPVWAGIDIQDTLTSYPVITGACRGRKDDVAVFACQNTAAGTDARIVVRSLRTGLWTEDTPPLTASSGIAAVSSFGDVYAYASGGTVYVQSSTGFTDGSSTVIPTQVKTHPIYPFGLGGNGVIHSILLVGEWRSAGTLALRVSYDDGVSFTNYDSFTLTGLTVGQTKKLRWELQQSDIQSCVLEITYTPSAVGEGFICHEATLLVTSSSDLADLDPADCA